MNSFDTKKAKAFEEFKALKEELEAAEARPYAPDPSPQFKLELRQQLLQQHEKRGLSRLEMGRLWRFAGTAVALLVLLAAVVYFWAVISNLATAVSPSQDTVTVAARTAVPEEQSVMVATTTGVPPSPTPYTESTTINQIQPEPQIPYARLISTTQKARITSLVTFEFTVEMQTEPFFVLEMYWGGSDWETQPIEGGHLLPITSWQEVAVHENRVTYRVTEIPDRIQQTTGTSKPVLVIRIWPPQSDGMITDETEVAIFHAFATSFDLGNEGEINYLPETPETAVVIAGELNAPDAGLCDLGFSDENTSQPVPCAQIGNDDHILSVVQKARPSAASPIEFEMTVGYEFSATEEVFLKLHYASPEWETYAGDGRPPIDGMGDWVALNPDTNSITLNFTGNPSEMAQIVGTEQPVLVVQIGYFVGEGDGRRLEILASQTFADVPLDLTNPEEIQLDVVP